MCCGAYFNISSLDFSIFGSLYKDFVFGKMFALHSPKNGHYGTLSVSPKVKVFNNVPTQGLFTQEMIGL